MSRKFGGLGLAGADSLPLAAFLASWAHVALAKEQGKLPAAIQTSIQDVLTGKRQDHFFHTLDGALSKATDILDDKVVRDCHLSLDELHEAAEEDSKLQHTLSAELLLVHRKAQIGQLDFHTKRLLEHTTQLGCTDFLTTLPTERALQYDNDTFRQSLRRFLFLHPKKTMTDQDQVMCGACTRKLPCNARHIQTCKAMGGPTHVHSAVLDALEKGLRTAGLRYRRERRFHQGHNQVDQRPDLFVRGMLPSQEGDVLADVVICHVADSNGNTLPTKRLTDAARSKCTKYDELARDSKATFYALAMSSLGAYEEGFQNWLSDLGQLVRRQDQFPSNPSCPKFRTYARQLTSAAFARESARQIDRIWRRSV